MNTLDRVKAVIGDHAGLVVTMIGDDQPIGRGEPLPAGHPHLAIDSTATAGLDFDSLDRIELALRLGEHFGIEIPDEDVDKPELGTAQGIADYIDGRLRAVCVANGPPPPEGWGIRDDSFLGRDHASEARADDVLTRGLAEAMGVGVIEVPGVGPVIEMDQATGAQMDGSTYVVPEVDYVSMSGGDLLAALGTDARLWTEAFFQHLKAKGEADDDTMFAWLANAIEAGRAAGLAANPSYDPDALESPNMRAILADELEKVGYHGLAAEVKGGGTMGLHDQAAVEAMGRAFALGLVRDSTKVLIGVLLRCKRQFLYYEHQHRAKIEKDPTGASHIPADTLRKAETNAAMAAMIDTALASGSVVGVPLEPGQEAPTEAPGDWPTGATTPLYQISGPNLDIIQRTLDAVAEGHPPSPANAVLALKVIAEAIAERDGGIMVGGALIPSRPVSEDLPLDGQ